MKQYIVEFVSRYNPLEGSRKMRVNAPSKKYIRDNWHSYIDTDEFRIKKIDEVK